MKIIEALKELKTNAKKIDDTIKRIQLNSARKSYETSPYTDPSAQVKDWLNSVGGLVQRNGQLTLAIAKTNAATQVTIEIQGKQVTKSITEWIFRRRVGVQEETKAFLALTNRGLKDEQIKQTDGSVLESKVVLHYDQKMRDEILDALTMEPTLIDTRLEIVNATTDLME